MSGERLKDTVIRETWKFPLGESLTFRAAGLEDLDFLTETRIQVLRAANGLGEEEDLSFVSRMSREILRKGFGGRQPQGVSGF